MKVFTCICLAALFLTEISRHLRIGHAANVARNTHCELCLPLCIFVFLYGLTTDKTMLQKHFHQGYSLLLVKSSYSFYLISAGFCVIHNEELGNKYFFLASSSHDHFFGFVFCCRTYRPTVDHLRSIFQKRHNKLRHAIERYFSIFI